MILVPELDSACYLRLPMLGLSSHRGPVAFESACHDTVTLSTTQGYSETPGCLKRTSPRSKLTLGLGGRIPDDLCCPAKGSESVGIGAALRLSAFPASSPGASRMSVR